MRWNRMAGVLVISLGLLLSGCQQPNNSTIEESSSSSVSVESQPQQQEHAVDEETVRSFLEEKLPPAYLSSAAIYQLGLEQDGEGVWCPILNLDMNADGSNFAKDAMEDILAVTELETYYLVEDCFADAGWPMNLTLIYYVEGEPVATVEKRHDAAAYTRTLFDGTVDTFAG